LRIGRPRHEHGVAGVDKSCQRKLDPLGRTARDQDAVGNRRKPLSRPVFGNCRAGFRNAWRRDVPVLVVACRAHHGVYERRWRPEAERDRVADVEVPDLPARGLDLPGFRDDIANRVREALDA
jgi:hypothetical protein